MANYNNEYEKLLASIQGSGQNWSQYDLDLAKNNPQAGYSIFESKNDWLDAQKRGDQAAMDAANKAANDVRQYYGSYDGGKDGSGFTLLPQYDEIPQFTEYESKYADQIQDLFDSIQNRDPFTYSPDADVSYQAYSEKYRNAGRQARDDTLGSMAAMTGGIPSSYAMTAAQQAQNNYNAALSDVLPQLEQLAYSKYVSEGNDMRQNLSTLMQMDNQAYQQHLDSYNNALNAWQLGYGVDRDRVGDIRYADETDYNRNQYERELALEQAMTMLKLGVMPSEELLTASKMNAGDVQGIYEAIRAQLAADTSGGSGKGSGKGKDDSSTGDIYAWLKSKGATDEASAYALLVDKGYTSTEASKIAGYYQNTVAPKMNQQSSLAASIIQAHDDAETGGRYNDVVGYIDEMKNEGASAGEIRSALKDAYDAGYINRNQYAQLINRR